MSYKIVLNDNNKTVPLHCYASVASLKELCLLLYVA